MSTGSDQIAFPESNAEVFTFGNGLELIVKEDHSSPVVSLQGWCRAGSIHEGDWLGAGMSHFLEHMLFKGTERRSANEIAQTVQGEGGYINAYTSFERTVYWIDSPSSGTEVCLDVLCDVLGSAAIPEDEFASEADVIRREIAMGEDNPEQVIGRLLFETAYAVHPCRYPVIGHLDLFNQLSRDDLYGYYRERYSPDNIFLVIVGDIETSEMVSQVEQWLGGLERRRRSNVVLPDEPQLMGKRREIRSFPTDLSRSRLSWPVPDGTHPDASALDLVATILGEGSSSRLYRSIREDQQLAHRVGAYCYTPSFAGQWVVSFDTDPKLSGKAEESILGVLREFRESGASEEELEKAKKRTLSSEFSSLAEMRGQASDLGSNWLLTRNLNYTREYVREIQAVTREDLARVARRYFDENSFTAVSLVPEDSKVGPSSASTSAKQSEKIRSITLENGLTVLLLSDLRLPFVHGTSVFRGGLLSESREQNGVTRLMARLLAKDTSQRSAEEVANEIESVGGALSSSIGNNSFGVSAFAMRPDLDLMIGMLGDAILSPAFLNPRIEAEKGFQEAQIKAELDRPFSVAMKSLRRALYRDHPYALELSGTKESLENLSRSDLLAHHERLVKGGNGVVGIAGNLDLDHAEDLIRARFETSLRNGQRMFLEPLKVELPSPTGQIEALTHEKEQAVLLIGFRTVDLRHPDGPALELIDEACSDMASRLFIRIREELGLAYSVGATRLIGLEPGLLVFYASTAPEKLDLVQEEMIAEINLMRREGLQSEEFSRAKASWRGKEMIHLQGAREIISTASIDELVGLGWDHHQKAPAEMEALTEDQVCEVAARYLVPEKSVIVRLSTSEEEGAEPGARG